MVSDYTGTYSRAGSVDAVVKSKLRELAALVDLHIVTADSHGTAAAELNGIASPHFLTSGRQDAEKAEFAGHFRPSSVAALGNGNNDRLMLKAVKQGGGLAIAVDNGEGCAIDAMLNSHIVITGAANALDLLLDPVRLKATLRC